MKNIFYITILFLMLNSIQSADKENEKRVAIYGIRLGDVIKSSNETIGKQLVEKHGFVQTKTSMFDGRKDKKEIIDCIVMAKLNNESLHTIDAYQYTKKSKKNPADVATLTLHTSPLTGSIYKISVTGRPAALIGIGKEESEYWVLRSLAEKFKAFGGKIVYSGTDESESKDETISLTVEDVCQWLDLDYRHEKEIKRINLSSIYDNPNDVYVGAEYFASYNPAGGIWSVNMFIADGNIKESEEGKAYLKSIYDEVEVKLK